MRILKEHTVAVMIDIQEKLFPHMFEKEILEKNMNLFVRGLRTLDIPLIVTEQYTKGLGFTIPSLAAALGDYSTHEKSAFSCCDDSSFSESIRSHNPVHVILAGIEAHVCVQQTAIDLLKVGYTPVVIADCVSSRKETDKQFAISRLRDEGAIITTFESVLFELLRYSGTPQFKAISQLVK
jgi:nicotinamidase-related amidase